MTKPKTKTETKTATETATETATKIEAATETATELLAPDAIDLPIAAPAAPAEPAFADLGLNSKLLAAVARLGYVTPTPIQLRVIPTMLSGRDLIGQAQTGTGKTAAFALPILQKLDMADVGVQALILAPTRELALQVAESVHEYAKEMGQVGVLAIFGGDPIHRQLQRLAGTVRVVVGTPGRVLDHLRRGTLQLDRLQIAVLDEADEMLRMGFLDDVEAILAQMPSTRQTTLFSATMPPEITRVAKHYLRDPETIAVTQKTRTVATIEQRYVIAPPHHKFEALARLLSTIDIEAALIFARTRAGCAELAEMLESQGFSTEAMHGDMAQSARLSVIRRLKNGQLRIVVATDVAARGLDVEQINLVVNMELPGDADTYVHRIGRTGRAGRAGMSILLLTQREEFRLRELERSTGQKLTPMNVPSLLDLHAARVAKFAARIQEALDKDDLAPFRTMVGELTTPERSLEDVAAVLARLAWGDKPIPVAAEEPPPPVERAKAAERAPRPEPEARAPRPKRAPREVEPAPGPAPKHGVTVWLSLGVGRRNGVQPRDIVGAIANETGVPGAAIGTIDIRDNFTLVEIAETALPVVLERMRRAMICGRYLNIRVAPPGDRPETAPAPPRPPRHVAPHGDRPPRRGGTVRPA